MDALDQLIAAAQAERDDYRDRSRRCAGTHDRRAFEVDAAAWSIRLAALQDARAVVRKQLQSTSG